jgi:hypothetical protein
MADMKAKLDKRAAAKRADPWHAVAIVCPKGSCAAAIALLEKRFLSGKAPRLPLEECGRPHACQCTYRHYDDRRAKPRRASEAGSPPRAGAPAVDRRAKRGRRQTDF